MNARATLAARIDAELPQTQCTRCGYPTCHAYADAIADGAAGIDRCPPGGEAGVAALARLLGRPLRGLDPAFGVEAPPRVARIVEDLCIGCTKCIQACPVDAIVGAGKRMHAILADECTGCELCLPPCPVDCIVMVPTAEAPLTRAEVLARAAHARGRVDARRLRIAAGNAAVETVIAPPAPVGAVPAVLGPGDASAVAAPAAPRVAPSAIDAGAADDPPSKPITRSAVLDAIARGKARRLKDSSPR